MSPITLFFTSLLVAFDVVSGLNIRQFESPVEGETLGYSVSDGLFKRQTRCPIGTRQCARVGNDVYCSAVCCYENNVFVFGCSVGFYCVGTGANAGCCPVGSQCSGSPPPCVDNGVRATGTTSACPATVPVCTSNSLGAPICSGDRTIASTITSTITDTETTTAEPATTTEETTTTETSETSISEPTTTSTTTVEITITSTSEIPEETSTVDVTTTLYTNTAAATTSFAVPTVNSTFTPLPPASSISSRTYTINLMFGLFAVAIAFFLF